MDQLRALLLRQAGPEREAMLAARALAEINRAIKETLALEANDATATTLQRQTVRVVVSHGAVAAQVLAASEEIVNKANRRLGPAWPTAARPKNIVTRSR